MQTKENDKRVVRDGEVVRVPILLMDGLQLSVQAATLHDGLGNRAGYKPGFVFAKGVDAAPSADAYHDYVSHLGDQWHEAQATSPTTDAHAEYVAKLGNAWRRP